LEVLYSDVQEVEYYIIVKCLKFINRSKIKIETGMTTEVNLKKNKQKIGSGLDCNSTSKTLHFE